KILNPTLYNIQGTIDENLEDLTNELEYVDITNKAEVNLECKEYGNS
ncbi:12018_t:CDS:2, partial [Funneliformis mosseae]